MNDFNRCNKVSGVYWLKKDVRDLQIKIKLKPQEGIISLPKFEDCTKGTNILKLENTADEYSFKWQEKLFSLWEVQRYTDIHNCITDSELNYHEIIENTEYKPSKIFTYVDEDCYLPLPIDCNKKNKGLLNLDSYLETLNLNDAVGRVFGGDTISTTLLFKSEENVAVGKKEWTAMHVVFDNSDYNEDAHLIYKQEVTLLSIYYNTARNYMVMMPDVNSLELNPYSVETAAGVPWGYQYAVEIEFDDECGEELVMLLKKLHKRWERKQRHLLNFVMPPVGKKQYYVAIEILTAKNFDMDNLYIEFDIKVPEDIQCTDALHGRTHTSEAVTIDGDKEWSYGHIVELSLLINTGLEPAPIKLFLEAISSDWWGRHRTEGYCYLPLTLDPGCYSKEMACTRPEEMDVVEAASRRFFLGGCHLIKDLNVLAEPQLRDTNYTYTSTGSINLRWSVISQAQVGGLVAPPPQPGTSTASALLLGAEAALKKYKKARARLAAATKDLSDVTHTGTGDGTQYNIVFNVIIIPVRWSDRDCYDSDCYDRDCYGRDCYDRDCYDRDCYGRDCYGRDCYDRDCDDRDCYDRVCYDRVCYDRVCYDRVCYDRVCYDRVCYDRVCYDRDCYDRVCYDRDCYDRDCYDRDCYDRVCYDRDCYDRDCYDRDCYDRDCYDRDCYDSDCYDRDCYDRDCYDRNCYDRDCYDSDCYDRVCYDRVCYDRNCYDRVCYDRNCYDPGRFIYK